MFWWAGKVAGMVSVRKWLAILVSAIFLAWLTWLAYLAFGETGLVAMVAVAAVGAWLHFGASERTGANFVRVGMTVILVGFAVYIAYFTATVFGPWIAIGSVALVALLAWKALSEI